MNELVTILEAAISGDLLRAVELADQAGLSRFDVRRLTGLIAVQDKVESPIDDPNKAYEQGWEDAIREATWAVESTMSPERQTRKAAS